MRKYLKNIEDIEALRNTDTKIYPKNISGVYYKFVNGVLCSFDKNDKLSMYNSGISCFVQEYYIEVEDEPSEDYIGKLGWVSDDDPRDKIRCGILAGKDSHETRPYICAVHARWKYFTPLTREEVEEYTGYKVVNNEMQANTLANNKMQAKEEV